MGSVDRIQEDLQGIDLVELMTPNDVFDSIQVFDSTVEVIGFIDGIESPRIVGIQKHKYFKFFINNGKGKRVQVVAWNDEIENVFRHIRPYYIIHLDGVQAIKPKMANHNVGNVSYELTIRSNTIVKKLGTYEPKPIYVKLSEILNVSGRIKIKVYVKTNFAKFDNKSKKEIGCGSVTDGIFKLEVRIENFSHEKYVEQDINKGDKIKLKGVMVQTVNPPYLHVKNLHDIKKLYGYMPFTKLLKGTRIPNKRKIDEEDSSQETEPQPGCSTTTTLKKLVTERNETREY